MCVCKLGALQPTFVCSNMALLLHATRLPLLVLYAGWGKRPVLCLGSAVSGRLCIVVSTALWQSGRRPVLPLLDAALTGGACAALRTVDAAYQCTAWALHFLLQTTTTAKALPPREPVPLCKCLWLFHALVVSAVPASCQCRR
jgi:hypothetical protein